MMMRMFQPVQFFKSLADETRLRCVALLQRRGELCVCELTQALQMSQPKISRHLALLRSSGLLVDRRQGLWIYYRINPNLPAWAHSAIACSIEGIAERTEFQQDWERLQSAKRMGDSAEQCAPGLSFEAAG
jgi:ArsR family transcriptional regulator